MNYYTIIFLVFTHSIILSQNPVKENNNHQSTIRQSFITTLLSSLGSIYVSEQVGILSGGLVGGLIGTTIGGVLGTFVGSIDGLVIGGLTGSAIGSFIGTSLGGIIGFFYGPVLGYKLSKTIDRWLQKTNERDKNQNIILSRKIASVTSLLILFAIKILQNYDQPIHMFIPSARKTTWHSLTLFNSKIK